MLVLSRAVGEVIVIELPGGERVRVMVTEIQGLEKVKLGVEAPRKVPVHREEIQRLIEAKFLTGGRG